MVSVGEVCWPTRTPFTCRLPDSIQTRLLPGSKICRWTSACPAWQMATTQMIAAIPIVIPRTVKRLLVLLRISAQTAARTSASRFMGGASRQSGEREPCASLVSQRFDGIEQGGFPRRVIAEEHADADREEDRDRKRFERYLHRPAEGAADQK